MSDSEAKYSWSPFEIKKEDGDFTKFSKTFGNDLSNHGYLLTTMLCCISCIPCCDDYYYKKSEDNFVKKIRDPQNKNPSFNATIKAFENLLERKTKEK